MGQPRTSMPAEGETSSQAIHADIVPTPLPEQTKEPNTPMQNHSSGGSTLQTTTGEAPRDCESEVDSPQSAKTDSLPPSPSTAPTTPDLSHHSLFMSASSSEATGQKRQREYNEDSSPPVKKAKFYHRPGFLKERKWQISAS